MASLTWIQQRRWSWWIGKEEEYPTMNTHHHVRPTMNNHWRLRPAFGCLRQRLESVLGALRADSALAYPTTVFFSPTNKSKSKPAAVQIFSTHICLWGCIWSAGSLVLGTISINVGLGVRQSVECNKCCIHTRILYLQHSSSTCRSRPSFHWSRDHCTRTLERYAHNVINLGTSMSSKYTLEFNHHEP